MKYIEYVNSLIRDKVSKSENCVLFGQNINAGSCLGGLTRNIKVNAKSKIFNSTNAENSLTGFGFGLMMNDSNAVFFLKQLDFLLLGIDHLVNTFNIIRSIKENYVQGSFTIIATLVDSGFDGPQSSFNGFYDLCAIARVNGYNINNKADADYFFKNEFLEPGFRIITLSQRLGREDIDELFSPISVLANGNIFQYSKGMDVTIVSSNFSYAAASDLVSTLNEDNIHSSHFHINNVINTDWEEVILNISKTKKLIVIDDSKSIQTSVDYLLSKINGINLEKKIILKREIKEDWLYPRSDIFEINKKEVLNKLL
jgi:pyruvate/2-oxoglutarate/acetoin dehydrogenase E1 component